MQKQFLKLFFLAVIFFAVPQFADADDKLLQPSDFTYLGGFRVPQTCPVGTCKNSTWQAAGNSTLSFGGLGISYNNNSIFIIGHDTTVSELNIPALVDPTNSAQCPTGALSCLNQASWKQGPIDVTVGNRLNIFSNHGTFGENDDALWGTLVHDSNLLFTSLSSYSVNNNVTNGNVGPIYTHGKSGLVWDIDNTSSPNFQGFYQVDTGAVDQVRNSGLVGGYMAKIPADYQTLLGGKVLTGNLRQSVISAGSFGPSLSSFDPDAMTGANTTVVPANLLLAYLSNNVFANFESGQPIISPPNPRGSMVTYPRGSAFPVGSKTVAIVGLTGLGETGQGDGCYGEGTSDPSQVKTAAEINDWVATNGTDYICGSASMPANRGNACCLDPENTNNKGNHAWPYVYRVWLYSADDLAVVKAGTKNFGDVLPYDQFDLNTYSIDPYRNWDSIANSWSTTTNPDYHYSFNIGGITKTWVPNTNTWSTTTNLNGAGMPLFNPSYTSRAVGSGSVAYDDAKQIIYISTMGAEKTEYENFPIIQAYHLNLPNFSDVNPPAAPSGLTVQ